MRTAARSSGRTIFAGRDIFPPWVAEMEEIALRTRLENLSLGLLTVTSCQAGCHRSLAEDAHLAAADDGGCVRFDQQSDVVWISRDGLWESFDIALILDRQAQEQSQAGPDKPLLNRSDQDVLTQHHGADSRAPDESTAGLELV